MPSVIRNKRTGHVSSPGTRAYEEHQRKIRENELAKEWARDNNKRGEGNEFYFTGRRRPLYAVNE